MRLRERLRQAVHALRQADVPDPEVDAALLMGHVLSLSRLQVLVQGERPLDDGELAAFEALLVRRLHREPLQYVLGSAAFMGHELLVRPGVLIPRCDTEALAEQAIARLRPGQAALDLCTGSGAVAISMKLACPGAEVSASDLSPEALALARENAARLGAEIGFHAGDLFVPFAGRRFDLIACNPPYIPSGQLPGLQAEVRAEPPLALDGGPDGLDVCRRLFAQAPGHLKAGGWLLLEMGDGQEEALRALARPDFTDVAAYTDGGGLPRVLAARLNA